ncbi:MAG: NC domain-containing protein [Oscillatoriales cyanobacterium]|nr:MAG: NC domain-containing protein [Oscillatoriales cyanobacterium]
MAYGDQLYVIRPWLQLDGVYEHHGIDAGDGTVIHYSKRTAEATVRQTSIEEFAQGGRIHKREYATCYIADSAVQRARSRIGEQKYNLLLNNCEHFATWCKTGISSSRQVREFAPIVANMQPDQLEREIFRSLEGQPGAAELFDGALGSIKQSWDEIQPHYNQVVRELNAWDTIAKQAVTRGRDDLARAALHRKRTYRQQAEQLKPQLDRLAELTEKLVRDRNQFLR